jgi:hypothetical protein
MRDNDPTEDKPLGPTPADVPLNRLPTVELTETQFQRAKEIARERSRSYEKIDGGRLCGGQTSLEAHLTGIVGELGYAIESDSCIDDSIYEYGDHGHDFRSSSLTIDCKTTSTHLDRPSLIVPVEPEPTADLFFLLHRIDTRTVRIIGFATYATVTDRTLSRKPGDALNYVIPQGDLWLPPGLEETPDDEAPDSVTDL